MPRRHEGFKGVQLGSDFFRALPVLGGKRGNGTRVRTYADPLSVAQLVSGGFYHHTETTLVFESGKVVIINKEGKLVRKNLPHLARLLSDAEHDLLKLFGVNVSSLIGI